MSADFITDEQIAEIEVDGCYPTADEFRALISRLRAAEMDAARYRWLREQDNDDFEFAVVSSPHFDVFASPAELDEAIDTAIKGDKQ